LLSSRWEYVQSWGALGDSLAPIIGLINSVALLVAIWSVTMQRQELAFQREELRQSREVMLQQAHHAEESARAQRDLAAAQQELAVQQKEANRLTWFGEVAQRRGNLATLHAALAQVNVASQENIVGGPILAEVHTADIMGLIQQEQHRIAALEDQLRISPPRQAESGDGNV
jgi:hypothetical protein